ncbi:hypothetical protein [Nonomuraea sp. SYSU D8015]|uniref:hypothetical protein n=1 Tax=Nonomuraea sp. SYSU D8015 TaxID=2593644 RepID=UPI001660DAFE|nr:hypothetical protein [Nonomuraea sp. SYSU D8015]
MLTMHQGDRTDPTPDPLHTGALPPEDLPALGQDAPPVTEPTGTGHAPPAAVPSTADTGDAADMAGARRLPSSTSSGAVSWAGRVAATGESTGAGPVSAAGQGTPAGHGSGAGQAPPSAAGVSSAGQVPPPPRGVTSVGQLAGLRPRRRPRDGGEVTGADVDLLDALDPLTWRTVAAWLHGKPSAATRQVGLQVLASFLRWLRSKEPALELLAVTGSHLDAYCEAARIGALPRTPARPLADKTVARKRSALLSFYAFAWQCGVVRHNPVPGPRGVRVRRADAARTLTREERRLLRQGVARLAADGRTAEATAVALLESTGASADALAGLTRQNVHGVPDGTGSQPVVVTLYRGRDDVAAFRVPPLVRPLLRLLCASRPAGEPLIRRPDGRPLDQDWLKGALADAALAGGIPEHRARHLHPNMLRAATVTDLLHDAGIPGS